MSDLQQPSHHRRIVVGIDGSEPAKAALAWAVRQAGLTGATVEAVIAWHYPIALGGSPYAPIGVTDTDFAAAAGRVLSTSISETVDPASRVKVSSTVGEGNPARMLIDAAQGADLLVVGSRGHGGFAEALLGSVSQHCVHHAPCPVVIIPRHKGQGAGAEDQAEGEEQRP
jgi:nucleotide-binding universal stress UspA family protein